MNNTAVRLSIVWTMVAVWGIVAGTANAADYSNGVFSDAVSGFSVTVPADWQRQAMSNNDSNTHLFVSPDQNVAVGVTTYSDGGKGALGTILANFQQAVFAGSAQIAEQTTSLNNIKGMLRAYRVQNPDGPVIVGAFSANGKDKSYVLWSMIPEAQYQGRYKDSDAILNTFQMTSPSAGVAKPKPAKEAASTAPPKQTSVPTAKVPAPPKPTLMPGLVPVKYRVVKEVPGMTFEIPTSYAGTVKGNQLVLESTDTARLGLTLVLQKMSRVAGGGHENMDKSVETALSQLRATPSAKLLSRKAMTVDGQPGVWLELTYESQDGTRRMAQVLTADASSVYWLGLNGPLAAFNAQVEDLNHAITTLRFTSQTASSLAQTLLAGAMRSQYETLVMDDSRVEFAYPKAFVIFEKAEGQSQWSHPKASGPKVVMVVQSMGRDSGNTAQSVYDGLAGQVVSLPSANMVSSEQVTVNGLPVYKFHFTLSQQAVKNHFKYAVLDCPGPHVVAVSFVGQESLLAEIDAHYAQLLSSVKSLDGAANATGAQLFSSQVAAAGAVEPKTPEETFHAIQKAVRASDWEGFVHLLHSTTVEVEMSRYFGELAEENKVNIVGLTLREAMLKVFRQVPKAAQNKAFLGRTSTIKGTRKEDDNRVLVMAQFEGGGEQYLWMFRENGHWRWMYK